MTTAQEHADLAARLRNIECSVLDEDENAALREAAYLLDTLCAQLAEAQRNAATPTPEAFHRALRLAQRESLDRTGSGVVNWDQADAVMSDEARHLVECYIAAIDAAKGEPS